jgi:hypothetical protein
MRRKMTQTFSAVLESKNQVKNITLSDDIHQKVFFEANLGVLEKVNFTDGLVMEIVGDKGVLRIDLPVETLLKEIGKKHSNAPREDSQ